MKFFTLILFSLLSVSCTSENISNDVNSSEDNAVIERADLIPLHKEEIGKAIALAKQNKDYRFLVTSGRSTSVPGIDVNMFQTLIELCGKKYNPATGDVITSQEQRLARKKQIDFMRQYNEQMLSICQNEFSK
mgnify:FL=1